jgi:pimeloyl-ACP methyl ester carboxylesterase
LVLCVVLGGSSYGLAACGASKRARDRATRATSTTGSPDTASTAVEGLFDVEGHKLYLKCEGRGSPTVVYLHGSIVSRGGSQSSGLIPGYLRDHARVCIYDRANVGLSDPVPGPLTGNDAVRDLHRLLSAAHVRGPYVLLGASFGGLIAVMYAATYPEDITGMVLLDAGLPDDVIKIDERFLPADARMQPGDWKHNIEQIDSLTTYRQAHAMQRRETNIPLTYIGTTRLDLDPSWPVEQMTAAIRAEQRAFVHRFSPGRLLILRDVPHFMERAIPQTVADEVKRVIAAASTR